MSAEHGHDRFDESPLLIELELEHHGLDAVIGRTIVLEMDGLVRCLGFGHEVTGERAVF
jgi:hypothetical protein